MAIHIISFRDVKKLYFLTIFIESYHLLPCNRKSQNVRHSDTIFFHFPFRKPLKEQNSFRKTYIL